MRDTGSLPSPIDQDSIKYALRSQSKASIDALKTISTASLNSQSDDKSGLASPVSPSKSKQNARKSPRIESSFTLPVLVNAPKVKQDTYYGNYIEFIQDRLYFGPETYQTAKLTIPVDAHVFNVEQQFQYIPFFADFGPVSIAHIFRFCELLDSMLSNPSLASKKLVMQCSSTSDKSTNAALLICSYMLLRLQNTPQETFNRLKSNPKCRLSLLPYRDAGYGPATYWIDILDCLKALRKGVQVYKFVTPETFNIKEYEFYERVENGDWNWVLPNFFLALATPHDNPPAHLIKFHDDVKSGRVIPMRPVPAGNTYEPLIDLDKILAYHRQSNVKGIIRLNNALYDRQRVIDAGIHHYELFFPDGSVPSETIIQQFLNICDQTLPYHLLIEGGIYKGASYGSQSGNTKRGGLAVHCKAGLGRTGSLICCWMMRTLGWTARECISWCRLMRPGSVVGPQQNWLETVESKMHEWGQKDNEAHSSIQKTVQLIDTTINLGTDALTARTNGGMAVPSQPRKIDRDFKDSNGLKVKQPDRNQSITSLVIQDVKAMFLGSPKSADAIQGVKRRVSNTSLASGPQQ